MLYIVLNLVEVFSIIVILGYYLQTDMGTNVPKTDGEGGSEEPEGDDKNAGGQKHHEVIPDDTDPREYAKYLNQTTDSSVQMGNPNMHVNKMIH